MSYDTKFDKSVAIVQGLPKDGPIQPSQEDKLYVRQLIFSSVFLMNSYCIILIRFSSISTSNKASDFVTKLLN